MNNKVRLFRKIPLVIEAFQMTEERRNSNDGWPEWMHKAWQLDKNEPNSLHPLQTIPESPNGLLCIRTLEGEMLVSWGDWIIQGVNGELYPCKDVIFRKSYEEVK
jgi:hypothetical protein